MAKNKLVAPVVKWVGGKRQLLDEITPLLPKRITSYCEPFLGGGAVLFSIQPTRAIVNDLNQDLITVYEVIRDDVESLLESLKKHENTAEYFYAIRDMDRDKEVYQAMSKVERASRLIYLNKTCFNGLYRVNKKGLFNVPIGLYKKPLICDEKNLRAVSEKLQNVTIVCGDYRESSAFIDDNTFVYFDPPYRPITDTASFTAYTENLFNDEEQIELAKFVDDMRRKGAKIVISNSDPKNSNTEDDFFDNIYSCYKIKRVEATRMINCNSEARGKIKELLISNF